MHVKEIVYCFFFLIIKVFLLFIFLKIYASVNLPEICSSFTTCISMLGFLTHWILTFILWWLSPLVFSFLFLFWRVSIKTTYIFLLCIYFFSMNYSCDEIYFLLIYQKSTSLSQYCSKKNDNKKFYSFQFNIEDFSISQYFFYYLIKFKNCSIGTCILILLLKYNRIS